MRIMIEHEPGELAQKADAARESLEAAIHDDGHACGALVKARRAPDAGPPKDSTLDFRLDATRLIFSRAMHAAAVQRRRLVARLRETL